jgi:hypothetical protein
LFGNGEPVLPFGRRGANGNDERQHDATRWPNCGLTRRLALRRFLDELNRLKASI